ncbi:hypothetical protein BC629DRAFT_1455436 [Irpex lacteus]|nr:hypothetical protein BC629DRAFT_1455436 [Irpex lacteus]
MAMTDLTMTVEKRVVDIPLEVSFGGGVTEGSGLETSAVINGTLEFASTNDENEENVLENELIGSELEVEEMSGEELVTEEDTADELETSDEDLLVKDTCEPLLSGELLSDTELVTLADDPEPDLDTPTEPRPEAPDSELPTPSDMWYQCLCVTTAEPEAEDCCRRVKAYNK